MAERKKDLAAFGRLNLNYVGLVRWGGGEEVKVRGLYFVSFSLILVVTLHNPSYPFPGVGSCQCFSEMHENKRIYVLLVLQRCCHTQQPLLFIFS